jgi:hypothetical protein
VPNVAVAVAENDTVTEHVGLHGLFVKVAVTPVGSALVEKVTGVVAPAVNVAVIEEVGLVEPWMTVKLLGDGVDRVNAKGAATVRDSEVV